MVALIQCKRVNNPLTTPVAVESVQFAEDYDPNEFTTPVVGAVGTAILKLDETDARDAAIIDELANNPTTFRVVMWSLWNGFGAIDHDRLGPPDTSDAFERKLDTVDTSKGGPSLLRSKEITFFKNV